jgi:hypothetical protein
VSRRARAITLAVAALVVAGLVAGCGSFDSKASGENLIRNYVNKFGKGQVTLTSVSCPSGVAEKAGTSYACNVVLHSVSRGQRLTGTVTIHIVSGDKVEIDGSQDVHVS